MAVPLKDRFDVEAVARLAERLAAVVPLDARDFTTGVAAGLADRGLKARVEWVARRVRAELPEAFPAAAAALVAAAELPQPPLRDFDAWPLCTVVELYGLDDANCSLEALARLTPVFTAEFAVRPFLNAHLDLTFTRLDEWTRSPDRAVRRLASEGSRPFLPWGRRVPALLARPGRTSPILQALHDDPADEVRRSVANHVNDLSRLDVRVALDLVRGWMPDADPRLVRRALRTLVRRGEPDAVALVAATAGRRASINPPEA